MGSDKVDVRFTTNYDVGNVNHVVGVIGSYEYLGSWDPKHALLLEKWGTEGCWSTVVKLPLSRYFEWKLILINKLTRKVQKWEDCGNRWDWIDRGPVDIIVGWNTKEMIRCSSCHCLVGKCWCTTIYTKLSSLEDLVDVTFRVIYAVNDSNESTCLSLIGSSAFLGNWNPVFSRILPGNHNPILTIQLPKNTCFEWKLVVLNSRYRNVIRWEERENRALEVQVCPLEVGVAWNQDAKVGYRCYWNDTCWVVSPCRCSNRYCKKAYSVEKSFQNNRKWRLREKVAKEANDENALDKSAYLNLLRDNHAHFSYDPIYDQKELNRDSITSADNIDGLLDQCLGIDGFGLDDIYSCSEEINGQQQQRKTVFNTEAKTHVTSKITKPEKETCNQNYVRCDKLLSNKQSVDERISEEGKSQPNDKYLLPVENFKMDKPTDYDNILTQGELKTNKDISNLFVCEKSSSGKHDDHSKVLPIENLLSSKLTDKSDLSPLEKHLPNNLTNNDETSFKTESTLDKSIHNNNFSPMENLSPNKSKIDDDMFSSEKPSSLTNGCTTTVVEKQSRSTIRSIIAHRDCTSHMEDKHVHFSDNPVSAVFEAKEASISPVDKTDSMLDLCCFSIDNLWLDETENCRVEIAGMQQQNIDNLSSMEKSSPNKPNCSGDVSLMEKSSPNKPTCSGDVSPMEMSPLNKPTNSGEVLLIEKSSQNKQTNSCEMLLREKASPNKQTDRDEVLLMVKSLEKPFSSKLTDDHDISLVRPTSDGGLLTIESSQQKQHDVTYVVPILKLSQNEHNDNGGLLVSQKLHPDGKADCALPRLEKETSNKPINDDGMAKSEEASSYTKCRPIRDNNGTKSSMLKSIECRKTFDLELLPTNTNLSSTFYMYPSEANPGSIKGRITTAKTCRQDRRTIVCRFSPQRTLGKKIELRLPKLRNRKLSFDRFFSYTPEFKPVLQVKSNNSKAHVETQLVEYRADVCVTVKSEKRTKSGFLLHMASMQQALTNSGGGDLSLPWTRHSTDKRSEQDIKLLEISTLHDSTPLPKSNIPAEKILPNIKIPDSEIHVSGSLSTPEIMTLQNLASSRNLSIIKVLQPDLPDSVIMFVFAEKVIPEYLSRIGVLKTRTKLQRRIESYDCAGFTKQRVEAEVKGSEFTGRKNNRRYNSLSLSQTNSRHKQLGSNFERPEKELLRRGNMSPLEIMPAKKCVSICATAFQEKRPANRIYLVLPNEIRMKKRVFFNSVISDRKLTNTCSPNLPSLNKQIAIEEGDVSRSQSEQQTESKYSSRSIVALTSVVAMVIVGSCIFDRFSKL